MTQNKAYTEQCVWYFLSDNVASAESVNSFKSRLDKFWSMHDFL